MGNAWGALGSEARELIVELLAAQGIQPSAFMQ